ncbi:hypothetical protein HZS_200, partial [Henneguya salminicola]
MTDNFILNNNKPEPIGTIIKKYLKNEQNCINTSRRVLLTYSAVLKMESLRNILLNFYGNILISAFKTINSIRQKIESLKLMMDCHAEYNNIYDQKNFKSCSNISTLTMDSISFQTEKKTNDLSEFSEKKFNLYSIKKKLPASHQSRYLIDPDTYEPLKYPPTKKSTFEKYLSTDKSHKNKSIESLNDFLIENIQRYRVNEISKPYKRLKHKQYFFDPKNKHLDSNFLKLHDTKHINTNYISLKHKKIIQNSHLDVNIRGEKCNHKSFKNEKNWIENVMSNTIRNENVTSDLIPSNFSILEYVDVMSQLSIIVENNNLNIPKNVENFYHIKVKTSIEKFFVQLGVFREQENNPAPICILYFFLIDTNLMNDNELLNPSVYTGEKSTEATFESIDTKGLQP